MIRKMSTGFVCTVFLAAIPLLAQQAGWLGVSVDDQTNAGPIVRSIEHNSPAEKAGLKEGDVIVQYNKEPVMGVQQLTRLIRETPVGRTVEMKVRRNNSEQTLHGTTEAARFDFPNIQIDGPKVNLLMDQVRRNVPRVEVNTTFVQSGIRVEQMTDQLREFFGAASNSGVLVASVEAGSAAEKAGLKSGDVIVAIDAANIRTPAEFSREMRAANGKVTLKIVRDKQQREIKLD